MMSLQRQWGSFLHGAPYEIVDHYTLPEPRRSRIKFELGPARVPPSVVTPCFTCTAIWFLFRHRAYPRARHNRGKERNRVELEMGQNLSDSGANILDCNEDITATL